MRLRRRPGESADEFDKRRAVEAIRSLLKKPAPENPDLELEFIRELEARSAHALLTCTRGRPGEIGATYALAWLPLDEADRYPTEVHQRHAANMRALRRSS